MSRRRVIHIDDLATMICRCGVKLTSMHSFAGNHDDAATSNWVFNPEPKLCVVALEAYGAVVCRKCLRARR